MGVVTSETPRQRGNTAFLKKITKIRTFKWKKKFIIELIYYLLLIFNFKQIVMLQKNMNNIR